MTPTTGGAPHHGSAQTPPPERQPRSDPRDWCPCRAPPPRRWRLRSGHSPTAPHGLPLADWDHWVPSTPGSARLGSPQSPGSKRESHRHPARRPTGASAPTPRSLPTTPRHPPPPKTPCSGHPAPCRCPDPWPPTPMASTSPSHHPPAPDHTRPAADPDKPGAAPSAMTSTPYPPSSPDLAAPDNKRYAPPARSTPGRLRSTSTAPRASAYLAHSPPQDTLHKYPCDFHSAPAVGSPHAPVPPTPLPAAAAAAGPSPAPPAARCQRTPHQNPPPRRGNRLPAPSPRWRVPTGATPPGSTGSAAPPRRPSRPPGAPSSSPGSPDLSAHGSSSPLSRSAERRRSPPPPPRACAPREQDPDPTPASPTAAAPWPSASDNQRPPSSAAWSPPAPTAGCAAQPPSRSRDPARSAAHPQAPTMPRA